MWRVTVDGCDYKDTEGIIYETNDLHEAVDMMVSIIDTRKGKIDLRKVER